MAYIEKTSPNTLIKKVLKTDITQESAISFKHDVLGLKTQTIDTETVYVDSETGTKYKLYIADGNVNLEEIE